VTLLVTLLRAEAHILLRGQGEVGTLALPASSLVGAGSGSVAAGMSGDKGLRAGIGENGAGSRPSHDVVPSTA
jgi:hypothetical protein